MKDRIWKDLRSAVFYVEYLGLYLNRIKTVNKIIETVLLITALVAIGGWNRFADFHVVWTLLLLFVMACRILKPKFLVPETEIASLQNLKAFYIDQQRDLDDLWYRFKSKKISENNTEKIFKQLSEKERIVIKVEKHDKIFGKEPIHSKAEELAREKLKEYI